MSELINTGRCGAGFRRSLLTTVSSLSLLTSACAIGDASAEDVDRPTVWIELGADLDRANDDQQAFAPPFVINNPGSSAFNPISPAEAQRPPRFNFGEEGKISFQPDFSDWVFSAAVLYGRASSNRHIHHEATNPLHYQHAVYHGRYGVFTNLAPALYAFKTVNFLDATVKQSESHVVLDFEAGKDVGLGLFGRKGTSIFSAGVRFAQFSSRMESSLKARPDFQSYVVHFPDQHYPDETGQVYGHRYHQYVASAQSARSFRGVGPSLSWNASTPFAGNPEDGELSVDWGANAGILFGRQKAIEQHQTSAVYFGGAKYPQGGVGYNHPLVSHQRARTITVPNVGGFAGATFSFTNFKVSVGYRGDFFFGAMDTGFDTAKRSTIGFYGPFASVSIGIGG